MFTPCKHNAAYDGNILLQCCSLVFVESNFVDWIENDFEDTLIMHLLFLMNQFFCWLKTSDNVSFSVTPVTVFSWKLLILKYTL